MKRHQVTKNEVAKFNQLRSENIGVVFTRDQIKNVLLDLGYPKDEMLLTKMAAGENPPIIRTSRGRYSFNPKPVFIERLQKVFEDRRRNKANATKKTNDDIQAAIELLKKNGFKVLKQIIKFEEI